MKGRREEERAKRVFLPFRPFQPLRLDWLALA